MSGNPILRTLAMAASAALLVTALAVPAMAGKDKVTICHKADTKAEKTLKVPARAVDAHLAHGDYMGACVAVTTVDACTWYDDPAQDGVYTSRGPVRLQYVGTEDWLYVASSDSPFSVEETVGTTTRTVPATLCDCTDVPGCDGRPPWYNYPGCFKLDLLCTDKKDPYVETLAWTANEPVEWSGTCKHLPVCSP